MVKEMPLLHTFTIKVPSVGKEYCFTVIRTYGTDQIEIFLLKASNKMLLFRSNRPLFRTKNLMHKNYEMKLIAGECRNQSFVEEIVEHIKHHIKWYENYSPNNLH